MTTFEGPIKSIPYNSELIYGFLSDFNNFEALIPSEKITNWKCSEDTCSFHMEGIGQIGLKIINKEPNKTIKYTADGQTPFHFFLWIKLKETAINDTKIKLTIKAELNLLLKSIVSKHVNKFLEVVTNAIAKYPYQI